MKSNGMKPFYTLLALLAALAACTPYSPPIIRASEGSGDDNPDGMATLAVSITSDATKDATTESEGAEAAVSLIEILVFDENGGLDCYKRDEEPGNSLYTTGLSAPHGTKTVAAVVNAPASAQIDQITTLEALRATTSHLVADNSGSSFVMYGEQAAVLVSGQLSQVNVTVKRLAARVRIDRIIRRFQDSLPGLQNLEASDFSVHRIFLVNVADDVNYAAPLADWSSSYPAVNTTWKTSLEGQSTERVAIHKAAQIYTAAQENQLAQGGDYEQTHRLYAYPNASDTQLTKLVVEVEIEGRFYMYPIEIANIKSNYSYEIRSLTITRLGNPSNGDDWLDPAESLAPVSLREFAVDLVVSPWNLVLLGDEGNLVI